MTVQELIDALSVQPLDAVVMLSNTDGCCECNPYGYTQEHTAYSVEFYAGKKSRKKWPVINTVVIS